MTAWIVALPLIVPIITALATFFLGPSRFTRLVSLAGAAALLATGVLLLGTVWTDGIQVASMGSWTLPFGIALVADHLAAAMVLITGVIGVAVAGYAVAAPDRSREARGYAPLFHVLLLGVAGAFLTGDLFNLYVWFEVMLIASFGLLVLGRSTGELVGGVKYVVLNLIGTLLFLLGLALLYGVTGTLNMADLHRVVAAGEASGSVVPAALVLALAFGAKAAVFPLFFWLPASYHTTGFAISALFAGLLTKVGVYALIRVFTLVFAAQSALTIGVFWSVAVLTMVVGVLGAASQGEMRRILSFHIVSQIGYMIVGLALFTPLALTAAVFYLLHHMVVKANLFLVAGVVRRLCGSLDLKRTGGLVKRSPWLAVLFLIPALSLAGVPPLSGFWAKFLVIEASIDAADYILAGVAIGVGLLTLFSMIKIWNEVFWKASPSAMTSGDEWTASRGVGTVALPIAGLAATTLLIGLTVSPALTLAERASAELMNPAGYVAAVLGGHTP
ncbi:MAG: proton-conducting transporter membrane subunit [Azospirillaceae bacterium]